MPIYKLTTEFQKYKESDLQTFAFTVRSKLDGNIYFPTTKPTLSELTIMIDEYTEALIKARNRGILEKIVKLQKKRQLINGLRRLSKNLTIQSNNQKTILLTTGFKLYDSSVRVKHAPQTPEILKVQDGYLSGEATLTCKFIPHIDMYECRYSFNSFGEDSVWQTHILSTKRKITIKGMVSGTKIWIQVRSINSSGCSNWSDPAFFQVR